MKKRSGANLAFALLTMIGGILPMGASAQGCAMCYQSAAASGSRSIRALRSGIFILMVPPFLICVGVSYLAYRRRNLHEQSASESGH
jgi:hypothetical protein